MLTVIHHSNLERIQEALSHMTKRAEKMFKRGLPGPRYELPRRKVRS